MSLTNIKLPDNVIAELYRQSLVEDESLVATPKREYVQEEVEKRDNQGVAAVEVKPAEELAKPVDVPKPVETAKPAETPKKADPKPTGYKFLGNNAKHITVIVHFANEVFVPESELQFLSKMLGACKLNLADVAIVNHATIAVAIEKLKEQLHPKHLLLFGVEPTDIQLPINFPSYKEQPYAGTTYLYAPGLDILNKETDEAKLAKRKLWDCLKRMFV